MPPPEGVASGNGPRGLRARRTRLETTTSDSGPRPLSQAHARGSRRVEGRGLHEREVGSGAEGAGAAAGATVCRGVLAHALPGPNPVP